MFDIDAFAADGNAKIVGLHRVGQTVTVGTTNAVVLQKGDILFTVDGNETFGGVAVTTRNIVLFRPTTLNDYSAGTFSKLLTDPAATGLAIRDFALVEQAMTVGGTALQAGDFLLTLSNGAYEKDISLFRPTTMATPTTGGALSELIDGASVGIGFGQKVFGIELVQQATTLGGVALSQGQILVTVNGNDVVGTNNLSVTDYDVFALTVTATGTGTSSASAAMVLRGADVALASGGEEIDALALVRSNTAPVLADTALTLTVAEDAGAPSGAVGSAIGAFTGGITDVDGGAAKGIAITGKDETRGIWWYSLNGGGSWAQVGTVSSAQSLLLADNGSTRLYFAPAANYSGAASAALTIRAWDQSSGSAGSKVSTAGNGGGTAFSSATDVVDVTVTAVNDAPVVTTTGSTLAYAKSQPKTPVDPGLALADIDNANLLSATVTISGNYANGQDLLEFTNQLGITGNWVAGTGTLTLSGSTTVANFQAALRTVSYRNTSMAPTAATRTVSFQVNDGASNSAAATRNIEVRATEVAGLWLSATNTATTSAGSGALVYNDGQVARLTDPNLALGAGTTAGTFSQVFDIDTFALDGNAKIVGLHYVGRAVTVGTTNAVNLQSGDVLLTVDGNETLGGVAVTKQNIVLFRPTVAGNYGAGSFSVLVNDPAVTGQAIQDFALVEQAMTVGGTPLQAGDFLLSLSSATYDKDISLFRPTTMATPITGGTLSLFIEGSAAGIGFGQKVFGLELVQQATILGNTLLGQGQLLVTVNGNDLVGTNNLSVTDYDVFALTVTATGAGSSSAMARMLLRGADVGLSAGGEEIDAIALVIPNVAPGNAAPVITLPGGTLAYNEKEPARLIDTGATVTDVDSPDFDGGTLVVDLAATGTINDQLAIRNQGTGAGQIGVSGADVSYGGVVIGSWAGGNDGFTPLVVNLNANATPAAAQALARNLTFKNISTNPSTTPRTLRLVVSDGDGATSATASKTITVTAVEDSGLWLSGVNNSTTSAGSGALTYNDGQVARLTDPNLALGAGTTAGTFSQVFDIDVFAQDGNAKIIGLHYVSRPVTVGTTNPVNLQGGDVLLSVDGNETLGGVAVTARQVVLFRPTSPGDYSAGTFSVLLNDPAATGKDVQDFALVEQAMTVGGTPLQAGDFLLSLSSATYDKDITLFRPTTMATPTTGGALSLFIDGSSVGIGFGQKVFGLELMQRNMVIGGQSLLAGQILVTVNGNDVVGTNNLSVTDYDIFVLNVAATGLGTSSAVATMLLLRRRCGADGRWRGDRCHCVGAGQLGAVAGRHPHTGAVAGERGRAGTVGHRRHQDQRAGGLCDPCGAGRQRQRPGFVSPAGHRRHRG